MPRAVAFIFVMGVSFSLNAKQEKFTPHPEDRAKTFCNKIRLNFVRKDNSAYKSLWGLGGEIVDSCAAIKVARDKKCNAAFMQKFAEMTAGKTVDTALKEKIKKELVPNLEKCLLDNSDQLTREMEAVIQLYHLGKIEDARKLLLELKK